MRTVRAFASPARPFRPIPLRPPTRVRIQPRGVVKRCANASPQPTFKWSILKKAVFQGVIQRAWPRLFVLEEQYAQATRRGKTGDLLDEKTHGGVSFGIVNGFYNQVLEMIWQVLTGERKFVESDFSGIGARVNDLCGQFGETFKVSLWDPLKFGENFLELAQLRWQIRFAVNWLLWCAKAKYNKKILDPQTLLAQLGLQDQGEVKNLGQVASLLKTQANEIGQETVQFIREAIALPMGEIDLDGIGVKAGQRAEQIRQFLAKVEIVQGLV